MSIGEGMVQYAYSEAVTEEALQIFLDAFAWAGRFASIPDFRMDAGSAVSVATRLSLPAALQLWVQFLAKVISSSAATVWMSLPSVPGAKSKTGMFCPSISDCLPWAELLKKLSMG